MAEGTAIRDAHTRFTDALRDAMGLIDGGLGWGRGSPAEPEPTALAALAVDDEGCRRWLARHQADDGAVVLETGAVRNTGVAALTALAMAPGPGQERALDFAIGAQGSKVDTALYRDDPKGWGWVPETFAWVEPTSRVLLATRILRPDDRRTIEDATTILRGRETKTSGWNYGNSTVLGSETTPYVQTTAMAVIAMAGLGEPSVARAIDLLRTQAPAEVGGLSLATALVAVRLETDDEAFQAELVDLLVAQWERTDFLGNLGTLAWAVLATAPEPHPLSVPS